MSDGLSINDMINQVRISLQESPINLMNIFSVVDSCLKSGQSIEIKNKQVDAFCETLKPLCEQLVEFRDNVINYSKEDIEEKLEIIDVLNELHKRKTDEVMLHINRDNIGGKNDVRFGEL